MSLRKLEDPTKPNENASKQPLGVLSNSGDNLLKNNTFFNNQIMYPDVNIKKTAFPTNNFQNGNDDDTVFNNLTDSIIFRRFVLCFYGKFLVYPQYDKNKNYYQEFWKIYLHNEILIGEMKEYANEIKNLKSKIAHTEVNDFFINYSEGRF